MTIFVCICLCMDKSISRSSHFKKTANINSDSFLKGKINIQETGWTVDEMVCMHFCTF